MSQVPVEARRVLILLNPKAGRRSPSGKVDRLADMLVHRKAYQVEVCTNLDAACRKANQWHSEGQLRALVPVGGDGTISDVVNRTEPGVPLAIFPAGTSNLIARHLRMKANPELVYRTIASGRLVRMDVGRAAGRLFVAMASCGFDAEVARRVHDHRKASRGGFLGYWSYVKPILDSIRSYQYPELRVHCDAPCAGREASLPTEFAARWVFALNLPNYGWGLPLAPWADQTDGLLDLCTFRRGSLPVGLWYVAAIHLGLHRQLSDCATLRVRRVRVTAQTDVEYQLDGDPAGRLPLEVEVVPGRMSVLLPPRPSAFSYQLAAGVAVAPCLCETH